MKMTKTEWAVYDVSQLASGTLAHLFGVCGYEDIDHRLALWVEWIKQQPDPAWECWQDCWQDYHNQGDDYNLGHAYGASVGAIRLEQWEIAERWPAVQNLNAFERGMKAALAGEEVPL